MHLGNGAITPECAVIALGVAAVGTGVAVSAARRSVLERGEALTAAALGAAVFAAQLFNVPVLPFSSAHLVGGVLLAWVLGASRGLLTMIAILTLQAVLLGDGGLMSLGANIVNMGLFPAAAVAFVRRRQVGSSVQRTALPLALTSFVVTVAAALAIVIEVSIGRSAAELEGLGAFASQMLWSHVFAGALEAAVTVAIVGALGGLASRREASPQLTTRIARMVLAMSVAVAVLSMPGLGFASAAPDLYEAAVQSLHNAGLALGGIESTPGGMPATAQRWQDASVSAFEVLGPLLAVFATVMAGGIAWGMSRCLTAGVQQCPTANSPSNATR